VWQLGVHSVPKWREDSTSTVVFCVTISNVWETKVRADVASGTVHMRINVTTTCREHVPTLALLVESVQDVDGVVVVD
jgi:hypothetical protein